MANVSIQVDKAFYCAGETVNGHVFLNLFQNMNATAVTLKFKGWESVRWIDERVCTQEERNRVNANLIWNNSYFVRMDSSDSSDNEGEPESMKFNYVLQHGVLKQITRHCGGRIISRFDTVLYNFGGSFIPAGQYSFPFSFKTGENYPASFMDKAADKKRKGRIKYEMQAFVRGFNNRLRLVKCKYEIVVRETQAIKNQTQEMVAHVKSCCCVDKGISKIRCHFEKNAYCPGEDARIILELDTQESKADVTEVKVQLLNDITYTSKEKRTVHFQNSFFTKRFQGLPVGQTANRMESVKILNEGHKQQLFDIKPTARGQNLKSVYYLKVQAVLAASCTCCSQLPVVNQPILIYPFINVNPFVAFQNFHPEEMPMMNVQISMDGMGVNGNLNKMTNPYQ